MNNNVEQLEISQEEVKPLQQSSNQSEQVPKKNKGNMPIIILLVIIILGLVGYIVYDKVNKENNKTTETGKDNKQEVIDDSNNVVNTDKNVSNTKTQDQKKIASYNEYMQEINSKVVKSPDKTHEMILLDNSFEKINLKIEDKCTKNGEKISLTQGSNKIEYTCIEKALDDDIDYDESEKYYEANVLINDTFKHKFTTFTTCGGDHLYTNGKNYIIYNESCTIGSSMFELYDNKGNLINKVENLSDPTFLDSNSQNIVYTSPFIKNGVLYYVVPSNVSSDMVKTTCNIMSIDLNENSPIKTFNSSFECYYTDGQ